MRLNQHFAVLGQYVLVLVFHPVGIAVYRLGTRDIGIIALLIGIIIAFPYIIVAFAVLNADIQFTVFITHGFLTLALVGTVHITDIATTEDITVTPFHTFVSANLSTIDMYLSLSEDITIGIERTTFT